MTQQVKISKQKSDVFSASLFLFGILSLSIFQSTPARCIHTILGLVAVPYHTRDSWELQLTLVLPNRHFQQPHCTTVFMDCQGLFFKNYSPPGTGNVKRGIICFSNYPETPDGSFSYERDGSNMFQLTPRKGRTRKRGVTRKYNSTSTKICQVL